MIEATQKWKKDKTVININVFLCECDGLMRLIGAAGCSHNSEYTYFYQCRTCKKVEASIFERPSSMYDPESMKAAGWKLVDNVR